MLYSNIYSRSRKQFTARRESQTGMDIPLPMTPAHLGREMAGWKKIS